MVSPMNAKLIAIALAANLAQRGADAHGYLKTPRSRNYFASLDPKWYGGTTDDPAPENCPHCLNIGGTEARCGKVGDHNYDYPPNAVGEGSLSPIIQECYEEGAVIDVESVLTAHHKGHFELKACPVAPGEAPTQACFDSNKLTFVEDKLYGAPPDPLYPERAYIPLASATLKEGNGNYIYHHRYKLPAGLRGEMILIQWYYVTANSCAIEGYDTYDFPPGFDPQVGTCTYVAPDGRGLPEQFWNCAEVQIMVTDGCGTSRPPSPPVTASPTKDPTPLPSKAPTLTDSTASPVETTTTTSSTQGTTTGSTNAPNPSCASDSNQCSASNPCANGMCCSQWGYCGVSEAFCGDCCQSGNCWSGSSTPPTQSSPYPTDTPTSSRAPTTGIYSPTISPTLSPSKLPSTKATFSPTGVPTTSSTTKSSSSPPTNSSTKITSTTSTTTVNTGATVTTTSTTTTVKNPDPDCKGYSNQCSATNPCANGGCCSQWGYCGVSRDYCGDCCQSGNCWA